QTDPPDHPKYFDVRPSCPPTYATSDLAATRPARPTCQACPAHQAAQRVQVPLVERIDRNDSLRAAFGLRRLEQHRQIAEAAIVHEASERLEPEAPVADVLVAIDAAAERPLRVVQVKHLQPIEADQPLELLEGRRVAAGRADLVAGGEQMARVEADADPAMAVGLRDDRCELLERRAERRALLGGLIAEYKRRASA